MLDLQNFTLSYNINGKDYGVSHDKIKQVDYRLFVAITHTAKIGDMMQFEIS